MTATATETVTETAFDSAKADAFAGRLMSILGGSLLNSMVDIGHRTGLFAAAAEGWATSEQLAARAGLTERYVREWLGAVTTGGLVEYDAANESFLLPPEHAALLTGCADMGPLAVSNTVLAKHVHQIAQVFQDGGGVPYAAYTPEFTDVMDAIGRGGFDAMLLGGYLPLAPGLTEALSAGVRAADVACGTGHALVIMARAFPSSTFVGYDLDEHAIARARAEAAGAGLTNVRFEVADAARLTTSSRFDVLLFMREPRGADTLAGNLANPMAPVLYSISTLHCLTVSLAHGGAGIGMVFGEEHARRLLADAGFGDVDVHAAPGHPFDAVYVTRATR